MLIKKKSVPKEKTSTQSFYELSFIGTENPLCLPKLGKTDYPKSVTYSSRIPEQSIFRGQKDGKNRPVTNLKHMNKVCLSNTGGGTRSSKVTLSVC